MFTSLFLGLTEQTNEPDPGGGGESASNSGSEGNKENDIASSGYRRQKKTKGKVEEGSPKKMTRKTKRIDMGNSKRLSSSASKINFTEGELSAILRNYTLTPEQIISLGYPIESSLHPGRAIIYKTSSPRGPIEQYQIPRSSHPFDVNAREFVPSYDGVMQKRKNISYWNCHQEEKINYSIESSESSEASKSSTRSADDSNEGDISDIHEGICRNLSERLLSEDQCSSTEKRCVRCGRSFYMMLDGKYLTQEKCLYHWGKLQSLYGPGPLGTICIRSEFSCCKRKINSKGCTTARLHVWNGIDSGVNGPLEGYVKTERRKSVSTDGNFGVYSMDCEMCYTTLGLELTKITLVSMDGRIVYDSYVKPENVIIDYNTRFSGITAKDLKRGNSAKCLKDVQNDLMAFISADTILIGHGLENDLKALKMIHSNVIDTSVIFPHYYGLPYRRSLRSLVNSILKRDIQSFGHDSREDAKACMELMLWRMKKDLKNNFDQKCYSFIEKF